MNIDRWKQLYRDQDAELTEEEIGQGVHFCAEWDGMPIDPSMPEFDCCTCFSRTQRQELEETGQIKFPGLSQ